MTDDTYKQRRDLVDLALSELKTSPRLTHATWGKLDARLRRNLFDAYRPLRADDDNQ